MERAPYWIQLEVNPEGQDTGYYFMDLSLVTQLDVTRGAGGADEVSQCSVIYNGNTKISFNNQPHNKVWAARDFVRAFNEYLRQKGYHSGWVSKPSEPGLIHSARGGISGVNLPN